MSDTLGYQVFPPTQAELDKTAAAQKADRDASDAKIAAKIALLQKLGLSEAEAKLLLG